MILMPTNGWMEVGMNIVAADGERSAEGLDTFPHPYGVIASVGLKRTGHFASPDRSGEHPRRDSHCGQMQPQIANAITAILLHAEAVLRHVKGATPAEADLSLSAHHINENAQRLWRVLQPRGPIGDSATRGPPGEASSLLIGPIRPLSRRSDVRR